MNYHRNTDAESVQVLKCLGFFGFGFLCPPRLGGGNYFSFGSRFSDTEVMQ